MMCQRDQSEGGTSKPWVHDVPEGSEIGWDQVHDVPEGPQRGWDQQTHVHGVPEGPERGWNQQTLGPWRARGTREGVRPGSMMCQRDQREGGTSIFMSMVCQRDQRGGGTSKPWVHDVP